MAPSMCLHMKTKMAIGCLLVMFHGSKYLFPLPILVIFCWTRLLCSFVESRPFIWTTNGPDLSMVIMVVEIWTINRPDFDKFGSLKTLLDGYYHLDCPLQSNCALCTADKPFFFFSRKILYL